MDHQGPIRVTYDRSIYLPEADLWLDPQVAKSRAFVSHAHSDHVARHKLAISTPLTRELMMHRGSAGKRTTFLTPAHGQTVEMDGFALTTLPAGHVFGSAMLHVVRLLDGASLLYTGDFKLRQGITGERAELRKADTLIMETTFGLPRYEFPAPGEIAAAMRQFVDDTIGSGGTPLLLGYSLGKAQEILGAMREISHPIMLHGTVADTTKLLAAHLGNVPAFSPLDVARAAGHVVIAPPNASQIDALRQRAGCRTAMVSGWGLDKAAKYRYRVDEVFPLSDHADYPELLQTVESVQP